MGIPLPASGNAGGAQSPLAGAAQGAAAGSTFGPWGALIGAGIGLAGAELSQPDNGGGGGGGMGGIALGSNNNLNQHVTTLAQNPTDVLFTPSVNVDLGGGSINPTNSGGLTSSANPTLTPDQTISTPQGNPLSSLWAQPGGTGLTLPFGTGIPPGGPGITGPGVSAALSPTMLLLLGGLLLLLLMAGKKK